MDMVVDHAGPTNRYPWDFNCLASARVRDGGLDLGGVTDDRVILQQQVDIPLRHRRDLRDVELMEGLCNAAGRTPAFQVWARLHGFVSLELGGNFVSMRLDPDKLFRAELERL
jgi:Tetracyclin repressor-like, C-terminal domain